MALGALGLAWYSAGTLDPAAITKLIAIAENGLEPGQDIPISFGNVELAMALTYATGTAFGSFFAGRASPHRSLIEPAIAAALVVGSFVLVIYLTPMGKLFISLTQGHLERLVSILAGAGIVAALLGAILGELASFKTGAAGFIRQTGLALVIATGALWSSLIIFGLVFANEVAKQALHNLGNPNTNAIVEVSLTRVATFCGVAAVCAAAASGFVTQLAARRRAVAPAALAAFAVFAGGGALSAIIRGCPTT